ncbi:MAG: SIALI-17 repeat-containing surface protein, partial [Granulicatella sp.]
HGSGTRTVNILEYRREKIPEKPSYNYTEDFKRTEGIPGSPTYAFWNQEITGEFPTIGDDDRFGTADDEKVNFNNETVLYYNNITKNFPPGITGSNKYNFKNESLEEILEEMHAQVTGILDYFERNVHNEADRKKVQSRKEELKQNIAKTIEMIKQNQIKVAVRDERELMFSQENQEILQQLRTQIEKAQSVLGDLEISLGTSKETLKEYNRLKDVELTTKEVLKYSEKYGFALGVIKSYHKDAEPEHYSEWEKVNPEVETKEYSVYANQGSVSISDDLSKINVVHSESHTTQFEFMREEVSTKEETDYLVKEIITPIRAYKVMSEGNVVVNHYYKEVKKISELPKDAPVLENPEFEGGVASIEPPIVEIPEYTGGIVSNEPPVLEVPEFKGGVPSEEPPVLDVPEFNGSVNGDLDEPLTLPELTIPNETNEDGKIEEQIPTPQQKNEQSSKEESKNNLPVEKSKQKIKEAEQKDSTASNKDSEHQTSVPAKKVEELPQTGTGQDFAIFGAAASSILAGLGLMIPGKQRKE